MGSLCGVVFEGFTTREHEHDDHRREIFTHRDGGDHRDECQDVEPEVATQNIAHHIDRGDQDDDRDIAGGDPFGGLCWACKLTGQHHNERHDRCRDDWVPLKKIPYLLHMPIISGILPSF